MNSFIDIRKKYSFLKYIVIVCYCLIIFGISVWLWFFIKKYFTDMKSDLNTPELIIIGILFSIWFLLICVATFVVVFIFVYSNAWLFLNKIVKKDLKKLASKVNLNELEEKPVVAIVVPVCNDFCEEQIHQSFSQTYKNCKRYILDDSTNPESIAQINNYAKNNDCNIIRRDKTKSTYRYGLSAAFDYFLQTTKHEWDYMVHVDSGDIISSTHVEANIPLFLADKKIGAIAPITTNFKFKSLFANVFGVFNKWFQNSTYMSSIAGVRRIPGAGVMYNKKALDSIEHWPDVICEDTGVSMGMAKNGFYTFFTNLSIMGEMFPATYKIFKKRNERWDNSFFQIISSGRLFFKQKGYKLNRLFEILLPIVYVYFAFFTSLISLVLYCIINDGNLLSEILNTMKITAGVLSILYVNIFLTCIFSMNKENWKYNIAYMFLGWMILAAMYIHALIVNVKYWILRKRNNKFIITNKNKVQKITIWNDIKTSVYWILIWTAIEIAAYFWRHGFVNDVKTATWKDMMFVFGVVYISIIISPMCEIILHFVSYIKIDYSKVEEKKIFFTAPFDRSVKSY